MYYVYTKCGARCMMRGVKSYTKCHEMHGMHCALCSMQGTVDCLFLAFFVCLIFFFLLFSCSKSVSVYLHVTCIMWNANCYTISVFILHMNFFANGFLALWMQTVRNWCMLSIHYSPFNVQCSNIIRNKICQLSIVHLTY